VCVCVCVCVCINVFMQSKAVLCCTNPAGKSWGILIMLKEVQNILAVRDGAHLHACTWSLKGSGLMKSS